MFLTDGLEQRTFPSLLASHLSCHTVPFKLLELLSQWKSTDSDFVNLFIDCSPEVLELIVNEVTIVMTLS